MARVRLDGVTHVFGGGAGVRDVTLEAEACELLALLGPSGCGKTTLLRLIVGLARPAIGRIWLGEQLVCDGGRGVFVPPERRGVGMVFQSYAVWPHMTVFGNVAYPLRVRRVPRQGLRERVQAMLETVKLGELAKRYPHELSGGQQQRVALARALVTEPQVLLLDEPFSNLDGRLRAELAAELRALQRRAGATAVLVTHDVEEAMAVADRVVVMDAGRVRQVGTPTALQERPETEFVRAFLRREGGA